jgi:hypothetical protein
MIIAVVTIVLFLYAMFLQIFNLVKYRNEDGLLNVRLLILGIMITLTVHAIRFFNSEEAMFFLFVSSVLFVRLYHGFKKLIGKK